MSTDTPARASSTLVRARNGNAVARVTHGGVTVVAFAAVDSRPVDAHRAVEALAWELAYEVDAGGLKYHLGSTTKYSASR